MISRVISRNKEDLKDQRDPLKTSELSLSKVTSMTSNTLVISSLGGENDGITISSVA